MASTTNAKKKSIVILIGGGHAAGKRTTANLLKEEITTTIPDSYLEVEIIDLKSYKDDLSKAIDSLAYSSSKSAAITVQGANEKNHPPLKPSRFRFDKLKEDLEGNLETSIDKPQKIFLIHGLYALYDKELRDMSQIKVFITSDPDTRLIRWIRRDVLNNGENNVSLEAVINSYLQGARAEMSDFIFPTKEFADVIMPRGAETNAVRLIIDGTLPYLANYSPPERMYLPHTTGNYLRPTNNKDMFEKEKFDDQKGKFYELD